MKQALIQEILGCYVHEPKAAGRLRHWVAAMFALRSMKFLLLQIVCQLLTKCTEDCKREHEKLFERIATRMRRAPYWLLGRFVTQITHSELHKSRATSRGCRYSAREGYSRILSETEGHFLCMRLGFAPLDPEEAREELEDYFSRLDGFCEIPPGLEVGDEAANRPVWCVERLADILKSERSICARGEVGIRPSTSFANEVVSRLGAQSDIADQAVFEIRFSKAQLGAPRAPNVFECDQQSFLKHLRMGLVGDGEWSWLVDDRSLRRGFSTAVVDAPECYPLDTRIGLVGVATVQGRGTSDRKLLHDLSQHALSLHEKAESLELEEW